MTLPRQPWKRLALGLIASLAAAAILAGASRLAVGAPTSELIVVDRHTGIAIGGYDPVAYFTDAAAVPGKGLFEANIAGAVWRFRNVGNRAAFVNDPDFYLPGFGGHDPVAIARGVAVAGDPRLWLIAGERLYLFYTPESRAAFAADSERIADQAEQRWPSVQLSLSP
jgi:hypothetical protein